jgi:hypothetical protein
MDDYPNTRDYPDSSTAVRNPWTIETVAGDITKAVFKASRSSPSSVYSCSSKPAVLLPDSWSKLGN